MVTLPSLRDLEGSSFSQAMGKDKKGHVKEIFSREGLAHVVECMQEVLGSIYGTSIKNK